MPWGRLAITGLAMLLAGIVTVSNWTHVVRNFRRHHTEGEDDAKSSSMVPLVSLLLTGVIAFPLCPYEWRIWLFIVPVLDIGNWGVLIMAPVALFRNTPTEQTNNEKDRTQTDEESY